jgi:hypothetical protein
MISPHASYDADEFETPTDEELCLVAVPAVEPHHAKKDIQQQLHSLFAVFSDDGLSDYFRFARTSTNTEYESI